jgi:hypothetical protein
MRPFFPITGEHGQERLPALLHDASKSSTLHFHLFAPAQMMHGHQREHEQGEALDERQGREPAGGREPFQEGTEQHQGYPEQD